ncbi:hypothetical protein DV738_g2465, partial [Chaetothyriales sp. CBS 135597]
MALHSWPTCHNLVFGVELSVPASSDLTAKWDMGQGTYFHITFKARYKVVYKSRDSTGEIISAVDTGGRNAEHHRSPKRGMKKTTYKVAVSSNNDAYVKKNGNAVRVDAPEIIRSRRNEHAASTESSSDEYERDTIVIADTHSEAEELAPTRVRDRSLSSGTLEAMRQHSPASITARRSRSVGFYKRDVDNHDASDRTHQRPGAEAHLAGRYLVSQRGEYRGRHYDDDVTDVTPRSIRPQERYAKYIGPTDEHDFALLDLRLYDDTRETPADQGSFRKVGPTEFFHQFADSDHPGQSQDNDDLDRIEHIVAPHGAALISLYFRIVHPGYPILEKKTFLEKYARDYREFSPPILAAVYILALNWWSYSPELAKHVKPDLIELEHIAFRSLQDVSQRAKLSTVQAGLLLMQRPNHLQGWQLTCQLVGIGQDLGLHLDCSNWKIPEWERALRKRLAWALFMQDTWAALIYVLEDLYSLTADMHIRTAYDSTKAVLERAKPIQVKLKAWWSEMPDCLRMDATQAGRLNSVGYLHLAYFATEITLHRRIIRSLSQDTDPYLVQICRSAAKARLISAMDFFNRLKPEHLKSFWYFSSKFNFALIGTFAGLCFVTSVSQEEAEFYKRRLQEYRWTLRVSNKSAEFLEIASGILESAVGALLKATDSIDSSRLDFPMLQNAAHQEGTLANSWVNRSDPTYTVDVPMEK